jgi:ABC-type multidrug transport system ATPase subunit
MTALIQARGLTKSYGRHRGIIAVSFDLAEGEVFGFLGPNGAGKTTTLRTLMGLLRPTSGSAAIAGLDCWSQAAQIKRLVGYLPGEFSFDPALTGAQILAYLGHLRGGVDQTFVVRLAERLQLDLSRRFRHYSHGNKQKVGLVQAFMHRPRLLVLDEPTQGLDPLNQQEFYRMVREVQAEGRTVLLSSHILPEIDRTCGRVAIIREGQLVEVNQVSNLTHLRQQDVAVRFATTASPEWFRALPNVRDATAADSGRQIQLRVQGDLDGVIKAAADHGAVNIVTRQPSLEEVFLRFYANDRTPQGAAAADR